MKKPNDVIKPTNITFSLRSFTLQEMDQILEQSENFRRSMRGRVDRYFQDMMNGNWRWDNGEPLLFDHNERLLNGQHRLMAARRFYAETGKMPWFWCAFGVRPENAMAMDIGDSRRFLDYLRQQGVANYSIVNAVVRGEGLTRFVGSESTLLFLCNPANSRYTTAKGEKVFESHRVSIQEAIDIYKRFKVDVDYWARVGKELSNSKLPNGALLAAIGYQLAKKHDTATKLFFSYLTEGSVSKSDDPVFALRTRLLDHRTASTQTPRIVVAAWTVKAYVAWMKGHPMTTLRWTVSGPKAEAFPSHIIPDDEIEVSI